MGGNFAKKCGNNYIFQIMYTNSLKHSFTSHILINISKKPTRGNF
jgi:hypothetical protein